MKLRSPGPAPDMRRAVTHVVVIHLRRFTPPSMPHTSAALSACAHLKPPASIYCLTIFPGASFCSGSNRCLVKYLLPARLTALLHKVTTVGGDHFVVFPAGPNMGVKEFSARSTSRNKSRRGRRA